jgi:hypothetical protein
MKICLENAMGKDHCGKLRHGWKGNVKMDMKEIDCLMSLFISAGLCVFSL